MEEDRQLLREINYRFVLNEVISDKSVHAKLSFDSNLGPQTISITIPSSGVLGLDVSSQEEADALHNRLTWLPSWESQTTETMNVVTDELSEDYSYGMDSGVLEVGAQLDNTKEYFLHGDSLKGLLKLTLQDTYSLNDAVFSKRWIARFYPATEIPCPFVLSESAISTSWIPEEGQTALPKSMNKRVPFRLKYWKENDQERRMALRNHLVNQMKEGHIFIPYSKTFNSRFTLFKDSTENYQLLIQTENPRQFSLHTSPLSNQELIARETNGLNIDDGKESEVQLDGHSYAATDWGNSTVYENYPDKMVVEFTGAKHCGLWEFIRQSEQLWDMSLLQPARNRSHCLPPEKVDVIIRMSREHYDRPEIAESIGYSNQAVWLYQKQLGLV